MSNFAKIIRALTVKRDFNLKQEKSCVSDILSVHI